MVKKVLYSGILVLIAIISLGFVFATHTTSPGTVTLNQSQNYLFNISLNNTNVGEVGNITQINITLPEGFSFVANSNGTNKAGDFTNTGNVLSWLNVTNYLINGSTNLSYFWFNATVSPTIGNYNISITSLNGTAAYSTNLSVSIVDLILPAVTLVSPVNGLNISLSSLNFNITATDNTNISSCWYTLNTGTTNVTLSANSSLTGFNATNSSIADNSYTAIFYCNDTSNNINGSIQSGFRIDTTAPIVTINAPIVNSSSRVIQINITANDTHGSVIGAGLNYTNISIYDSLGNIINSTTNSTTGNSTSYLTVTSDGTYTINATSYDLLGWINSTTKKVTVDSVAPTITVLNPVNNSNYYANQSILISFNRSDTTVGSLWYNFNETTNQTSVVADTLSVNVNYTTIGWKNITFYSNDSFNNVTTLRYLINITAIMNNATSFMANDTTYNVSSGIDNLVVPYNSTLTSVTLTNESQVVSLDLSQLLNGNVTTANNFSLSTQGTSNYSVYIPAGTVISGSGWNGKINLPTLNSSAFTEPELTGYTTSDPSLVIDLGGSSEINFSSPVKINITGKAGSRAAWSRGSLTLNNIATSCVNVSNYSNIDAVTTRECYVDSGNDLIIWTYHFTSFATYSATADAAATTTTTSSGGSTRINDQQLTAGSGVDIYLGDVAYFTINNVRYNLLVLKLGSSSADVNLYSPSQKMAFSVGEEKKFDFNNDSYYDLSLKLNSVTNRLANFNIKSIHESVTPQVIPSSPGTIGTTGDNGSNNNAATPNPVATGKGSNTGIIITAIVIVVVIVIIFFLVFNSYKKKRYYRHGY